MSTAAQLRLAIEGDASSETDDPPPGRTISFTIPGDPRAKGRPKTAVINGHAVVYTPSATRREEGAIRLIAEGAMSGADPLDGPLAVRLEYYVAVPASWSAAKRRRALTGTVRPTTKPDRSNLEKLTEDACNAIIWRDDKQIVEWSGCKFYSDRPRVEVCVTALHAERA